MARPGVSLGYRPEVSPILDEDSLDQRWRQWRQCRVESELRDLNSFRARLIAIAAMEEQLRELDLVERNYMVQTLRKNLSEPSLGCDDIVTAFALIRIVMEQVIGIRLYDEQLYAGWCLLVGHFVEMQTGEGKTVTAALPATVMGLAGVPVHVITANEYLVSRDAQFLRPLYKWFGLTSSAVLSEHDDNARRDGYAGDIAYLTHQQVVFDYLRDAKDLRSCHQGVANRIRDVLELEPSITLQRGLCFAVVDEADSVLIDDARTPLILAETNTSGELALSEAAVALAIARGLQEKQHFLLNTDTRRSRLTESGLQQVRSRTEPLVGSWQFERYRNERINQALSALHLFRRDIEYLVRDDKVVLIDQATGRPTQQRRLQHGLHRMLEAKERCSLGPETSPISAISYQRFFTRYHQLSGMSGTLTEARQELRQVYGVGVITIPTHKPSRASALPVVVMPSREHQLASLVQLVDQLRGSGRSVLVGTRSVQLSEAVSRALTECDVDHAVLNARQDAEEAETIAKAGLPGQVTVATNMAGRGTDITLASEVVTQGGLHVINLEINDSKRIDRQLHGRAARQEDPGSFQDFFCLDDDLLRHELSPIAFRVLSSVVRRSSTGSSFLIRYLVEQAQNRIEMRRRKERLAIARGQAQLQRALAVGGYSE